MQATGMSEAHARVICTWSYAPPYDVYSMGPWSLVVERSWTLADETQRACEMLSLVDEAGTLVGYLRLHEQDGRWLVGVGLAPTRCGEGLGAAAVALAVREHQRRAPGATLWLEVRDWNVRAIRCYERAGFEVVERVAREAETGRGVFAVMRRTP